MRNLDFLGWQPFFEQQLDPTLDGDARPARVVEEQRGSYRLHDESGVWTASLAGRLRHDADRNGALLPCVGDWVVAGFPAGGADAGVAVIRRVLARQTRFARQDPGRGKGEQNIAANVDVVFLVQSLNRDFNARRLERYLALLWESGAQPVIVLSKADLCPDPSEPLEAVEECALGVPIVTCSAVAPGGLDPLLPFLGPGRTAALVGSSGVGKSSIVNGLLGEELLRVQAIREIDDRGRHTTTSRHIVILPSGALLLDTPGMRTVILHEGVEGVSQAFEDVEAIASSCRFRDCTHQSEPGCAVRASLETGTLDPQRLRSYDKLQREARHQAMKTDQRLRLAEQRRWRRIHLEQRRRPDKRAL